MTALYAVRLADGSWFDDVDQIVWNDKNELKHIVKRLRPYSGFRARLRNCKIVRVQLTEVPDAR